MARRVCLNDTAKTALERVLTSLSSESGHISLVPSKAASWIVVEFAERYFEKERSRMLSALLNRKSVIRSALKNVNEGTDAEIVELEQVLRELRQKGKVSTKGRACQANVNSPPLETQE